MLITETIKNATGVLAWFVKGWVVDLFLCSAFETFHNEIASTRVRIINKTRLDNREYAICLLDTDTGQKTGPYCMFIYLKRPTMVNNALQIV